jgi:hypothetical protein
LYLAFMGGVTTVVTIVAEYATVLLAPFVMVGRVPAVTDTSLLNAMLNAHIVATAAPPTTAASSLSRRPVCPLDFR